MSFDTNIQSDFECNECAHNERIIKKLESQVKELREALTETVKFYDRCVENKILCSVLGKSIFSKAKQLLNKQP